MSQLCIRILPIALLTLSRILFGLDGDELSRLTNQIQGPSMLAHLSRVTPPSRSPIPSIMSFHWECMFALASLKCLPV